jgi:diguanylate cyclase (GGDEF)-like protein/PAS domain S-box-containing protein
VSGVARDVEGDHGELRRRILGVRDVHELVETRRALRESEHRYRLLAENAADVVLMTGPDRLLTWVSPAVERTLGWTPGELLGTRVSDLLTPEFLTRTQQERDEFYAGTGPAPDKGQLFQLRTKSGEYRWMSGRVAPAADADGQPAGAIAGLRDVNALVNAEQRHGAVLESMLDPHVLLRAVRDHDGRIIDFVYADANPAACDYMRMTADELVGCRLLELLPGQAGSGMLALYARAVDSGEPLVLNDYAYPHEILQDERRYDIRGVRVGDALSFTWRDVTDRHTQVQALADSEGRYRLLAENASDIVFRGSNEAVMQWISPSVTSVLGWRPEEMIGRHIGDFIHTDDVPLVVKASREVAGGVAGGYEARLRRSDGTYLWMKVDARPLVTSSGEVVGRVGSAHNVQAEVTARKSQAAADEKYRLLAENAADAVYLAASDRTIEWISPAVERLLGWAPDALVGTKSAELVHSEDHPTYRAMVASVQEGRITVQWEFRARQADGSYRWMSAASSPILDDGGLLTGRTTTLRDIEQEVADRQALARSEQTFRLAMDGAPQGLAVVGLQGPILQTNQMLCDLVGRDAAWLRSHKEADLIHPDDYEVDRAARERLLAGKSEYNFHEGRLIDADGHEVWVQHSLALVRDERDTPMFYVSQFQDITDARRLRAELHYRVSHDALTGLINRDELTHRLDHHLRRIRPGSGLFALLYCDLDYFKSINDTGGHASGDTVLQETARRITSVVRESDEVSRLGGDEFVVLLADVDQTPALEVADQVRRAVGQPMTVDGQQVTVTVSIGVALAEPGISARSLLRDADEALYQAKQRGRNQTVAVGQE